MVDNKQLLENYAKRLGSSKTTKNSYLRFAQDFLDYADGNLDRETIDKYVEHLRMKHKYSDGSVNFVFRIIRTLFGRNNLAWPFARGESPQIREDQIAAPALDPGVIGEMIESIKRDDRPDEKAFLAISTIYGTRRVELVHLTQNDVNLRDRTIHIATAKHGRERTHLIPEEIIPYLEEYDFDKTISQFSLFTLWYRLEYRIGLTHIDQVGFHSIRRTLNTMLLDHLPETTVMSFLRWKQRTSSHMPYRYSAQRFVGREGMTTKVIGVAKDVDTKVFDVHPFLEFWR